MKYCIEVQADKTLVNEADELMIKFNRNDDTLIEFLQEHQQQKCIIWIEDLQEFYDKEDLALFIAIKEKYPDLKFTLKFNEYHETTISTIKDLKIPFFFNWHIRDWETLNAAAAIGVSDVYITEILGFELDKVREFTNQYGIKVRVFPNVSQTQWKDFIPAIKTFFIRPEDIDEYEDYVDVCEFYGSSKFIKTLYKVYTQDKEWFGPLKEIIIGLNDNTIDNKFIIPKRFTERRIKCGAKCLKCGSCNVCERILELADTLEDNKLLITIKKEKGEKENGERTES